jgi:antirestriction protein ArdC
MDKDTKTTRKDQYMINRKTLISMSQVLRMMVKEGAIDSVNEGLKDMYIEENPNIDEFKTFHQWKEEGATVRKGEKAFLIWGQPRHVEQVPEGSTEPEEFKYWPICYLFANTQVITAEQMKEHREKATRPESPAAVPARELEPIDELI